MNNLQYTIDQLTIELQNSPTIKLAAENCFGDNLVGKIKNLAAQQLISLWKNDEEAHEVAKSLNLAS